MSDQLLNCVSCDLDFSQQKALIEHLNLAHLPKKALHKCSKCPKEFISRQFLDKHKSVHEEKMAQDKGGIISESIFNLILKKREPNHCPTTFQPAEKS